jgi:ABC-type uncharacterized transport system substrate-binding protein
MMSTEVNAIEEMANKIVEEEKTLVKLQEDFALQSAEFAAYLKTQQEAQKNIDNMWANVKKALIEAEYFDVLENDNFKISVTPVTSIKVVDVDKLPENLVEMVKVAKMDQIKKDFEYYNTLPDGVVNQPIYRLNKKVK